VENSTATYANYADCKLEGISMAIDHDKLSSEVKSQFVCAHTNTEIRVKTDKAGRALIAHQCVRCGQQRGSYLRRKDFSAQEIQALPRWDAALEQQYSNQFGTAMRSRFEDAKSKEREAFLRRHGEFLQSEVWLKLRSKVLNRAQSICEGCAEAKATQVHHLNYARWGGNELLLDLVAVCDACHIKLHPRDRHPVDLLIESRNLPENNRGAFFENEGTDPP
jgi:hypothetical protein